MGGYIRCGISTIIKFRVEWGGISTIGRNFIKTNFFTVEEVNAKTKRAAGQASFEESCQLSQLGELSQKKITNTQKKTPAP